MTIADDVRSHCLREYVERARDAGAYTVTIRAGDVHDALALSGRQPAVCAALGSDTFERFANVRRIAVEGPVNGASTLFVYLLLDLSRPVPGRDGRTSERTG